MSAKWRFVISISAFAITTVCFACVSQANDELLLNNCVKSLKFDSENQHFLINGKLMPLDLIIDFPDENVFDIVELSIARWSTGVFVWHATFEPPIEIIYKENPLEKFNLHFKISSNLLAENDYKTVVDEFKKMLFFKKFRLHLRLYATVFARDGNSEIPTNVTLMFRLKRVEKLAD